MSYSIGHTLVTPLPDGRVSYTPCRHCGDPCRGHSMAGRMESSGIEPEVERVYDDYWRPLVERDGRIDFDQVKRELYDYRGLMERAGKVYDHITGGRISKLNTRADAVIAVAEEIQAMCRTCGEECPRAQCDACRADGAASEREEERAAVVAWLRKQSLWRCVPTDCADAIERGEHRS